MWFKVLSIISSESYFAFWQTQTYNNARRIICHQLTSALDREGPRVILVVAKASFRNEAEKLRARAPLGMRAGLTRPLPP